MPRFVFTGPPREYVTLAIRAEDGTVHEFDIPPDHRWHPTEDTEPAVTEETEQ